MGLYAYVWVKPERWEELKGRMRSIEGLWDSGPGNGGGWLAEASASLAFGLGLIAGCLFFFSFGQRVQKWEKKGC